MTQAEISLMQKKNLEGSGRFMQAQKYAGVLPTLGGICNLIVVMGIGRFAFTAILPGMMADYGFGEDVAGMMASWNYAGYLAGVLLMRNETPGPRRFNLFAIFLLLSLASTAAMGMTRWPYLLHALRFVSGLASGVCFVLGSAIVFDTLAAVKRPALAGLLFSGVGTGIIISGLAVGPLAVSGGTAGAWFGLALLGIPPALFALLTLRPGCNCALPGAAGSGVSCAGHKRMNPRYRLLIIAYFLEGFGYIIGVTFLVTQVQNVTHSPELAQASWLVTGCAAALSAPLWRVAARRGYLPMLILAFVLQSLGVLLLLLSNSVVSALSGGLLLGGTFMGISVLALQYGCLLSNKPSANTVAVMTGLYAVGQIIGPVVAGGNGMHTAFLISGLSLLAGAGLLIAACFIKTGDSQQLG